MHENIIIQQVRYDINIDNLADGSDVDLEDFVSWTYLEDS